MSRPITSSNEDRALLGETPRACIADVLDHEISGLEAECPLDAIGRELGPAFYDPGVLGARVLMERHLGEATEVLADLIRIIDGARR